MSVSFASFLDALASNPVLALIAALTAAVVLVNGWTDAPNAIAAAVTTGALPFRRAAVLAAACSLLGVLAASAGAAPVARALYSIADFGGSSRLALCALCAAMTGIVVWGVLAWLLGVPTSESHALAAGVSGAALAMPGGFANLRLPVWGQIGLGLLLSLGLGLLLGRRAARALNRRAPSPAAVRRGQIAAAAAMSLLHGAQDGQKFIGTFLLGAALAEGRADAPLSIPLWTAAACAVLMALGTLLGGRRIIDTVGRDMVPLSPRSGLGADLGAGLTLLLCTLAGLPVSTTHAKTAALLGAGSTVGRSQPRVVRTVLLTWLLTFPCCGAIAFFLTRLFLSPLFCATIR